MRPVDDETFRRSLERSLKKNHALFSDPRMDDSWEGCRVCRQDLLVKWGTCDDQMLWQCNRCGLTFSWPYPTQDQLDALYAPPYHAERHYDGSGIEGGLRRRMYELDIKDLESTIEPQGYFFDMGCAEGLFLELLDSAWDKWGWDVSDAALEKAQRRPALYDAMFTNLCNIKDEVFHVIHLRGTFEHMLEPRYFMHQAWKKLRPGGWFVLSNTPNIGSRMARIFRGNYRWVLPGEHVNLYSMKTIRWLAAVTDFKIVRTTYPYFGTPYASPMKDLMKILLNLMLRRESPPWWGDIFTTYLRKEG